MSRADQHAGARGPSPGLRNAQLGLRADFVAKLAVGFGFMGAARLLGLFRTFSLTGSAAGDVVVLFAVAATLGVIAGRLRVRRHIPDDQENG